MQEDSNKELGFSSEISKEAPQGETKTDTPEFEFPDETNDADLHALSESVKAEGTAFVEPKKNKKKKLAGIAAAFLIVAVTAGACAMQIPSVKNAVAIHTMSPRKYFKTITDANIKTAADKISSSYEKSLSYRSQNTTGALTADISVELGDMLKESLASDGVSFSSMNLSYRSDYKDKTVKEAVTLGINKEDVFHLVCYTQAADSFYLQLPDLSASYLYGQSDSSVSGQNTEELINAITALQEMTPDEINTMAVTYLSYIPDHYTKISDITSETTSIDGISNTFSTLTVSISEKDAYDVLVDMFEKVQSDTRLTNFINSFFAQCGYPLYTADWILDELKENQALATVDDLLDVTLYIDKNGVIKGVSLKPQDNPENEEFRILTVSEGKNVKGEMNFYENNKMIFGLQLSYTKKDNGATGTLTMTAPSDEYLAGEELAFEVVISFEDLKHNGKNDKFLSGTMTITTSGAPGSSLSLVFKAGDNAQAVDISINLSGYDAGTIRIRFKTDDYQEFVLPDSASAKIYDMNGDLSDYEKEIDMDSFLTNLYQKLGIDLNDYSYEF
ncbi:MAG: hypothetical protein E7256_01335 [Lachnospiraceae bacterium]|nr:hypothetical protein [Lachnospiraceae bacterium]